MSPSLGSLLPSLASSLTELVILLTVAGCGYTLGAAPTPGGVRHIRVAPVEEPGIDIDAAAVVSNAVRRAVARSPSTKLASGDGAEAALYVTMLDAKEGLAPYANPGARAAQYKLRVRVKARLMSSAGEMLWSSGIIEGEAAFLSPTGGLESVDGARRRAMVSAAEDAADRLIDAMTHGRGL